MNVEIWLDAAMWVSGVATALTLAATCGLRTFLAPLAVTALGLLGWMPLADHTAWMASVPALLLFGSLLAIEVGADKIPGVDHTFDAIGLVLKPVMGTLVAVSVLPQLPFATALLLGGAVGGLSAMGLGVVKGRLRMRASRVSGGLAGAALSCAEDVWAVFAVVVACVFAPSAALMLGGIALLYVALEIAGRRVGWGRLAPEPGPPAGPLPTIVPHSMAGLASEAP
ncbi:MAG: DUF4126 domain-containing protein [Myxococcales bacterium]|nr:DUF4126 domain-containing protein [Myxococcales bacterium]